MSQNPEAIITHNMPYLHLICSKVGCKGLADNLPELAPCTWANRKCCEYSGSAQQAAVCDKAGYTHQAPP